MDRVHTMDQVALKALTDEFQVLRAKPSHFDNVQPAATSTSAADDADRHATDACGGRKHVVMKTLAEQCAMPGTSVAYAMAGLGIPDAFVKMPSTFDPCNAMEMDVLSLGETVVFPPGPVIMDGDGNGASTANAEPPATSCFIYYWRGRHDYFWFAIDGPLDEEGTTIKQSGWYNSYE